MNTARPIHGKILAASGFAHVGATFLPNMYLHEIFEMAREGFVHVLPYRLGPSAIDDHARLGAFSWVLVGVAMMVAGDLVDHVERRLGVLPMRFAWTMLGIGIVTAIMMPASGYLFLLLPQTIFLVVRQYRLQHRRTSPISGTA